jgi:CO/xanthine dehydrogenase Mo-binding subunit
MSGWKEKHRKLPEGRGVGIACSAYLCGAGLPIYWNKMPQTGVQVLLDRSGQVTVFCGATEIGQGSDDVLAAMVAEVLGIDPYDVRCVTGDTGTTPIDLGSYSSRVTVMMGNAAIQAAEKLKAQIVRGCSRAASRRCRTGSCCRAGACSSPARREGNDVSPRPWSARKKSSARSARSAPTHRRRAPGDTRAQASALRPLTRTLRVS